MSLLLITHHRRAVLATTAAGVAAVLAFAGPVSAAFGAGGSGTPVVQTSETVKANLDASGKLDVARVFSQIEATGKGRVNLADPTSTHSLRNLDGWGAPSTKDGKANYNFTVNGEKHFRTVAKYTSKLPVSITVNYKLDGKSIQPDDLAGKSGKLDVSYTVVNTTGEPTEISYPDGHGKNVTETVNIVTPYVGQLALDLPKSFDNVTSTANRADQAGDGHGGRLVTWTMVLFDPIGATTQKFGFSSQVDNAVLPSASVQIVPVSPQDHPELKFGQNGFSSGAKTGRDLTAGAAQIDDNVLKLRDGASTLLDGLTKLQDGAKQLSSGLSDGVPAAVNGSKQLANGLQSAADGAGKLKSGSGQLSAGANKLSRGFNDPSSDNDLIDGSQSLAGALGLISGGLGQLNSSSTGLPAAKAGAVALQAGVDQLVAGLGSPTADHTVLNGLALLSGGTSQMRAGVTQLQAGADQLASPSAGLPAAKGGVDAIRQALIDSGAPTIATITAIQTAIATAKAAGCDATCAAALTLAAGTLSAFATGLQSNVGSAVTNLAAVSTGLQQAIAGVGDASNPLSIRGGLALVAGGLTQSAGGLVLVTDGVNQVKTGLKSGSAAKPGVAEGLAQLVGGLTTAISGVSQLAPGAAKANAGAGDLADGIASAGDGVAQLSAGAVQLSHGSARLSAGLKNKLAPGAVQLSDGLQDLDAAKDGANQIAGGLGDAKAGDKQIVSGAGHLSTQGTSPLVAKGDDTAKAYGKQYATMQALNKKGADNALPIGAPTGSTDNRGAFDITLAGAGHEGPGSPGRGITAIVILGIGAAAMTLLRGRFAA